MENETLPNTLQNEKAVGIEVTASTLRAVLLENRVSIVRRFEVSLGAGESLVPRLSATIAELREETGAEIFGVAISGLVNRLTNRVILSVQMPELESIDLATELKGQTGVPVQLENDANAAAYGEFILGAGRGSNSLFYATIGNGIGGSIILDGNIWRGANGFAGEFGHIAINEDGVKLEEVASAANIIRRTHERLFHDSTSSLSSRLPQNAGTIADIVAAAKDGDDFAQMMLERTGAYIGTAIASVINLLNVERVVLGGEVMGFERVILDSITRKARERSFSPSFEATRIVAAQLGTDAAAIGAALLAGQKS
jgi:glucokinase